jgi:hypothetical protein
LADRVQARLLALWHPDGFMAVWLYGFMALWLYGFMALWLTRRLLYSLQLTQRLYKPLPFSLKTLLRIIYKLGLTILKFFRKKYSFSMQ